MWGCGKTGAGVDEIAVAIGRHVQYPWRYVNIFTGDDTFRVPAREKSGRDGSRGTRTGAR
jgi:hypothetical protein